MGKIDMSPPSSVLVRPFLVGNGSTKMVPKIETFSASIPRVSVRVIVGFATIFCTLTRVMLVRQEVTGTNGTHPYGIFNTWACLLCRLV